MRPLIVGEVNPYGSDPEMALYPLPENASGGRLCKILGMTHAEYLRTFDRANLCVGRWSWPAAKEEARRIRETGVPLVLLGRRVAQAFRLHQVPFFFTYFQASGSFLLLPHPSGRSRLWNDKTNVLLARTLVKRLLKFGCAA